MVNSLKQYPFDPGKESSDNSTHDKDDAWRTMSTVSVIERESPSRSAGSHNEILRLNRKRISKYFSRTKHVVEKSGSKYGFEKDGLPELLGVSLQQSYPERSLYSPFYDPAPTPRCGTGCASFHDLMTWPYDFDSDEAESLSGNDEDQTLLKPRKRRGMIPLAVSGSKAFDGLLESSSSSTLQKTKHYPADEVQSRCCHRGESNFCRLLVDTTLSVDGVGVRKPSKERNRFHAQQKDYVPGQVRKLFHFCDKCELRQLSHEEFEIKDNIHKTVSKVCKGFWSEKGKLTRTYFRPPFYCDTGPIKFSLQDSYWKNPDLENPPTYLYDNKASSSPIYCNQQWRSIVQKCRRQRKRKQSLERALIHGEQEEKVPLHHSKLLQDVQKYDVVEEQCNRLTSPSPTKEKSVAEVKQRSRKTITPITPILEDTKAHNGKTRIVSGERQRSRGDKKKAHMKRSEASQDKGECKQIVPVGQEVEEKQSAQDTDVDPQTHHTGKASAAESKGQERKRVLSTSKVALKESVAIYQQQKSYSPNEGEKKSTKNHMSPRQRGGTKLNSDKKENPNHGLDIGTSSLDEQSSSGEQNLKIDGDIYSRMQRFEKPWRTLSSKEIHENGMANRRMFYSSSAEAVNNVVKSLFVSSDESLLPKSDSNICMCWSSSNNKTCGSSTDCGNKNSNTPVYDDLDSDSISNIISLVPRAVKGRPPSAGDLDDWYRDSRRRSVEDKDNSGGLLDDDVVRINPLDDKIPLFPPITLPRGRLLCYQPIVDKRYNKWRRRKKKVKKVHEERDAESSSEDQNQSDTSARPPTMDIDAIKKKFAFVHFDSNSTLTPSGAVVPSDLMNKGAEFENSSDDDDSGDDQYFDYRYRPGNEDHMSRIIHRYSIWNTDSLGAKPEGGKGTSRLRYQQNRTDQRAMTRMSAPGENTTNQNLGVSSSTPEYTSLLDRNKLYRPATHVPESKRGPKSEERTQPEAKEKVRYRKMKTVKMKSNRSTQNGTLTKGQKHGKSSEPFPLPRKNLQLKNEKLELEPLGKLPQIESAECEHGSQKTCPVKYNSCGIGYNAATLYSRNRKAIVLQKKKRDALPPITVKQLLKKVDKKSSKNSQRTPKKKQKKQEGSSHSAPSKIILPSLKRSLPLCRSKGTGLAPITSMSFNPSLSNSMFVGVLPNILKTYVEKFDNLLKNISSEYDKQLQGESQTSETDFEQKDVA